MKKKSVSNPSKKTYKKLTKETLHQQESYLSAIIENMPGLVWLKDKESRFLAVNKAFAQSCGKKTAKEVTGKTDLDIWPKELAEKYRQDDLDVMKKGKSVVVEEPILDKSLMAWFETFKTPVFDEQGEIIGTTGYAHDITERKKAEQVLHQRESYLSAIIENMPGFVWLKDKESRFLAVNQKLTESLNKKSAHEVIGKTDLDFFPRELYEKYREDDIGVMKTGKPIVIEEPILDKSAMNWFETFKIPVFDEQGKVLGTTGYARDITERKLVESQREEMLKAIASEKERLAVTLHSIGDGVITTDTSGKVTMLNSVAEKLTGWSQEKAAGQSLATVFHIVNEQTRQICENPAEKVLSSGNTIELANHTLLIARNGSEVAIADSGAPIRNPDGEIIGVVIVFRDMTEKQKSLDNMLRAQKLESVGLLAGGIAHDFNNLLSIIYGSLELMESSSDQESTARHLANCLKTMKRAKAITMQLLTFAKGGAPIKKTGSIVPFLQDTVHFALSGSNCLPSFKIDDGLWAMEYDENQMGQVFDNIVINATQSMPEGGNLEVSAKNVILQSNDHPNLPAGNYVKMSFKDDGAGILPENISRIFDPYFTTKQTGRGLGLASAYSIVQQHDGYIDVESVLGEGTTLYVYLPASLKPYMEKKTASLPVSKGTGKILIMDDEADLRMVLKQTLISCGFSVVEASNGKEVLEILSDTAHKEEPFTAVILDLTIPGGMGGKETVKKIRNFAPHLPVFVYSGYSDDPVLNDPKKFGFAGSLKKPYKREELIAMLSKDLNC